jgi:DNA-binding MarR family transcriptional regulator
MRSETSAAQEATQVALLMNSLVARLSRDSVRDLSRLGVTFAAARVLELLHETAHPRCSAIATRLGFDAPTLSHLLRSLAARDLVTRERAKDDNRVVEVRLTAKGRVLARACHDIAAEKQRLLLDGVDPTELMHFTAVLARMNANLDGKPRRVDAG